MDLYYESLKAKLRDDDAWKQARSQAVYNIETNNNVAEINAHLDITKRDITRKCGSFLGLIEEDLKVHETPLLECGECEECEKCDEHAQLAIDLTRRLVFDSIESRKRPLVAIIDDGRHSWFTPEHTTVQNRLGIGPGKWWRSYESKLREKIGEIATNNIKEDCFEIINGALKPPFDNDLRRKSLVIGHVQSGKTASMAGVIAMAIDAGYNFIIVLSGTKENLRQQTNSRLVTDLEDQYDGLMLESFTRTSQVDDNGNPVLPLNFGASANFEHWVTQKIEMNESVGFGVVLKNVYRLRALIQFIRNQPDQILNKIKCILIDDEADEASIFARYNPNIPTEEQTPSAISGLIRELLYDALPNRVAYLAYTATPFSNILHEPPTDNLENDRSLFPTNFIHHLRRSPTYIGFREIFGDPDHNGTDLEDGLGICNSIPSEDARIMRGVTYEEEKTPSTLKSSIAWYILASVERQLREERPSHNTMLIHSTQHILTHRANAEYVNSILRIWREDLPLFQDDLTRTRREKNEDKSLRIKQLFDLDFQYKGVRDPNDQFWSIAHNVLEKIIVVEENGQTDLDQRLQYPSLDDLCPEAREAAVKYQIACGGNTLARGLTLEGLVSSYFCRKSTAMDTLMQMGRWCGYRPGYGDLPRIWLTDAIKEVLADTVVVEKEVETEINLMKRSSASSPYHFGAKLRSNPGGIKLTRRMAAATTVEVNYNNLSPQTIIFNNNIEWLQTNWEAGVNLLCQLEDPSPKKCESSYLWTNVNRGQILSFLKAYQSSEESNSFDSKWIHDYIIGSQFFNFNIAVIGTNQPAAPSILFGGVNIRLLNRSRLETEADKQTPPISPQYLNIKALRSPNDLRIDLPAGTDVANSELMSQRAQLNMPPLLLLYPINKDSINQRNSSVRVKLDAPHHVLGAHFVFATSGNTGDGAIRVALQAKHVDPQEDPIEENLEENPDTPPN